MEQLKRYGDGQLRGALLEEAILRLLYSSGYDPVLSPGIDQSLKSGTSGLEVRGRGEWHQVDAIADFALPQPFVNPQRLLVEAKFMRKNVGIEVVRNALGVAKDVSEYWVGHSAASNLTAKSRYHYLYAVFSASQFTKPAQNFGYAHDIHLLPLANSAFFRPVIDAIKAVRVSDFEGPLPKLKTVREYVRNTLFADLGIEPVWSPEVDRPWPPSVSAVINAGRSLSFGFIAMLGKRMPVFLVANPDMLEIMHEEFESVRIRWLNGSWFIETTGGRRLFSFDLPQEISDQYANLEQLDRVAVANIKQDWMSSFYAYERTLHGISVKRFVLDQRWFEQVQRESRRR